MKPVLAIIVMVLVVIVSCKKEKDAAPASSYTASDYLPLKTGNYWVYDTYVIEQNGEETLIFSDSARIDEDTLIRGQRYYRYKGCPAELAIRYIDEFVRDSADCIINQRGVKFFSVTDFSDTLFDFRLGDTMVMGFYRMTDKDKETTVPAGTFKTITCLGTHRIFSPFNQLGAMRTTFTKYAAGVGLVSERYFLFNQPVFYERRLVKYHLE